MIIELSGLLALMALGQFSPGPDMLLLTRTAVAQGFRAGVFTVLGIVTGLAVHTTVALTGVAAIMNRGGLLANLLSGAAAAYLVYLAWGLWQSEAVMEGGEEKLTPGDRLASGECAAYRRGLLCNLLNPKAALFFVSVLTPFVSGERPTWWPFLVGVVILAEALILWILWVLVLQHPGVRRVYFHRARLIDRTFAIGLVGLALSLMRLSI